MGVWLRTNGESIYGTRQGPLPPRDWGVSTQKGDKVYLHILKLEDDVLALPQGPRKFTRFTRLDGKAVEHLETKWGTLLRLPPDSRDPYDTVVVLQ
jgi:alpha-L-fucosidase